jgi:hypothetical protein
LFLSYSLAATLDSKAFHALFAATKTGVWLAVAADLKKSNITVFLMLLLFAGFASTFSPSFKKLAVRGEQNVSLIT